MGQDKPEALQVEEDCVCWLRLGISCSQTAEPTAAVSKGFVFFFFFFGKSQHSMQVICYGLELEKPSM